MKSDSIVEAVSNALIQGSNGITVVDKITMTHEAFASLKAEAEGDDLALYRGEYRFFGVPVVTTTDQTDHFKINWKERDDDRQNP
jgi:hypothetical protein